MKNNPEKFKSSAEIDSSSANGELFAIVIDFVAEGLKDAEIKEVIQGCLEAAARYLELEMITEADTPAWLQTAKKLNPAQLTEVFKAARVVVGRRELEAYLKEKAAEPGYEDDAYDQIMREVEYRENSTEQGVVHPDYIPV